MVNELYIDMSDSAVFSRGKTLYSKEPDTINWINDYIRQDDVFYDIGANIGIYSLYAAKFNKAKVYSFEPESSNYYFLNKNIYHNNLFSRIKAYNIALNDTVLLSELNLSDFRASASNHQFNHKIDSPR